MEEPNGVTVSTQSETRKLAVHAGPSLLQKLFQTDSVLPKKMSFFHHKTWSHVTSSTWAAMVVSSHSLGVTSTRTVLSLTPVCHTPQASAQSKLAQQPAQVVKHEKNTSVLARLLNHPVLPLLNQTSMLMVQLRLDSLSTLTL